MATGLRLLGWSWLRVVAAAALLSLAVEGLQYFVVAGRDASLSDLLTNTGGAAIAAAVAPWLPDLVEPAPRDARRYLAGAAVLWLAVLGLSAVAMMPWAPGGQLRSECTRSAKVADVFSRTVRSVVLNDVTLPCDRELFRGAPLQEALRSGAVTLDVVLVSGSPERSRVLIHTVRGRGSLLMMLAQHRRSVAFTAPTASRRLRLFSPILRLPDAFPPAAGLPVEIHAGVRERRMWISSRHSGIGATMELALSPSQGWTLLFPWGIDPRRPFRLVTALWIAGFILPAGYCAAGLRSRPVAAAGIALALGAGLWLLPRVAGYAPVHWSEWLGGGGRGRARVGPLPDRGLSSEPMRLSFHQRILLILICLGAIPTAAAILGWGLTIRCGEPGGRDRARRWRRSARPAARCSARSTRPTSRPPSGAALEAHAATLNTRHRAVPAGGDLRPLLLRRPRPRRLPARRRVAVRLGPAGRPPLAPAEPADRGADRLDRHTSGGWSRCRPTGRAGARRSSPRCARRCGRWRTALERGRAQEIEAERLRAFRETARRVAHEMRNPLTPIRLAVAQLARARHGPDPGGDRGAHRRVRAAGAAGARVHRVRPSAGRARRRRWTSCELLEELARTSVPPEHDRPARPRSRRPRRSWATTIRCAAPSATSCATRSRPAAGQGELEIFAAPVRGRRAGHDPRPRPRDPARARGPHLRSRTAPARRAAPGSASRWPSRPSSCTRAPSRSSGHRGGGATFVVRLRGL